MSGLSIDLLADHPRVTAVKNYALLENVEVSANLWTPTGAASPGLRAEDARAKSP